MILASHLFFTNLNSLLSGIIYQRFDQDKAEGNYPTNRPHICLSQEMFPLVFFCINKADSCRWFPFFFKGCQKNIFKENF